ncbi:MAG: hypothetical protein WD824_08750 [Cyclobacteriaceae bacterium]
MSDGQKNNTRIRRLKEKFNRMVEICAGRLDGTLYTILTRAMGQLLETTSGKVDARAFDYLDMLIQEIVEVAGEGSSGQSESIEALLWQYNFNSRQYFLYYIKRISVKEKEEETILGKLELLAHELKKVNQAVIERNVQYTSKYPSLQDVVGNWVKEELAFLRTKQQLTITLADPETQIPHDFKIALDLSVAQFSCLIRALMEKKLVLNTNLTELAVFLSSAFVTKRSENISVGSFRKKYYNLEEGTKKSVIDSLNKVIDWLLRN